MYSSSRTAVSGTRVRTIDLETLHHRHTYLHSTESETCWAMTQSPSSVHTPRPWHTPSSLKGQTIPQSWPLVRLSQLHLACSSHTPQLLHTPSIVAGHTNSHAGPCNSHIADFLQSHPKPVRSISASLHTPPQHTVPLTHSSQRSCVGPAKPLAIGVTGHAVNDNSWTSQLSPEYPRVQKHEPSKPQAPCPEQ